MLHTTKAVKNTRDEKTKMKNFVNGVAEKVAKGDPNKKKNVKKQANENTKAAE
ncbi:hypothetical protein LINGRAHAP2_LOCUS19279, partial [Linum grandiflorum]